MSAPLKYEQTATPAEARSGTAPSPLPLPRSLEQFQQPVMVLVTALFFWGMYICAWWVGLTAFFATVFATFFVASQLGRLIRVPPNFKPHPLEEWQYGFLALNLAIVLAVLQPLRLDPLAPPSKFPGLSWWRDPVERNAFLRATNSPGLHDLWHHKDPGWNDEFWAVGDAGVILYSNDGGVNWIRRASGVALPLRAIGTLDGTNLCVAGDGGVILVSVDSGTSWWRVSLDRGAAAPNFASLVFTSPTIAFVFGMNGMAIVDVQHAVVLHPDSSKGGMALVMRGGAVDFHDAQNGVAVDARGNTYISTDGGTNWPLVTISTNGPLLGSLMILPAASKSPLFEPKWAVQRQELLLKNAAAAIKELPPGNPIEWDHAAFLGTDADGKLWVWTEGSNRWTKDEPGGPLRFRSLLRGPGGSVYALTTDSSLVQWSPDSARPPTGPPHLAPRWTPYRELENGLTNSVVFAGTNLWAVGGWHIAHSESPKYWTVLTLPHHAWPARWFWFVSGSVFLWAIILYAANPTATLIVKSRLDQAVSDAPIETIKADKLGFGQLAVALSRFLQNANTNPPYTVAVTGDWGSGKSSIMNLMREDLKKSDFPTVWFNAWHHQNETQIFASFLKSITQEGVPPVWSRTGWAYRGRLHARRIMKRWLRSLSLLLLMLGLIALCWALWKAEIQRRDQAAKGEAAPPARMTIKPTGTNDTSITNLAELLAGGLTAEWATKPSPKAEEQLPGLLQFIVNYLGGDGALSSWLKQHGLFASLATTLATGLIYFYRVRGRLKSYGVDPSILLTKAADGLKPRQLESVTSFQLRFAEQFREVTLAMNLKQLVIFIDDLDRCRPPKVAELLEAINFLVVSGKCFVVLGFARDQVEAAVGLGFSPMAAEMNLAGQRDASLKSAALARENRRAFARKYLRKLINLEIQVPTDYSKDAGIAMLANAPAPAVAETGANAANEPPEPVVPATTAGAVSPTLSVLLLGGLLLWLAASPALAIEGPQQNTVQRKMQVQQTAESSEPAPPRRAARQVAKNWPWTLAPLALFGGIFLLALRQRAPTQAEDPPTFREALDIWFDVIRRRYETPRELKRFLNRTRFEMLCAGQWRSNEATGNGAAKPTEEFPIPPEDVVYLCVKPDKEVPDQQTAMTGHQAKFPHSPKLDSQKILDRVTRYIVET